MVYLHERTWSAIIQGRRPRIVDFRLWHRTAVQRGMTCFPSTPIRLQINGRKLHRSRHFSRVAVVTIFFAFGTPIPIENFSYR